MLSRTADNLYWLGRYVERAENLARILEVASRMSMMPQEGGADEESEWKSAIVISGCEEAFKASGKAPTAANVKAFIGRAEDNPSSIYSCLATARDNARAVRNALTAEMWENLNATWLEFDSRWDAYRKTKDIGPFLSWVKERSSLFRGSLAGTMIRDEAYYFLRCGTFIERGDNTARILDVKYHVLLPDSAEVGGSVDYFQWATILRAVSALGSYRWFYKENPKPWRIAEFLILREEMPRSLISCLKEINENLEHLAADYGHRHECHRIVGKMYSQLRFGKADEIFQNGLHEFLTDFIVRNNNLGNEIGRDYHFHG